MHRDSHGVHFAAKHRKALIVRKIHCHRLNRPVGEENADAALARIKGGENFGDVASDMSSCPSKEKGGDLGWFKKGQMVAEFEAACFGNEPGTIVKVQSQFGWHVVRHLFCVAFVRGVHHAAVGWRALDSR